MTVFHVYVSLADFGGDPLSGILIEAVATPAVKKSGTSVHSNAPERAYTGVDGTCTLNLLSIPGVWYQIRPVHSKGVFNPVNLAGYVPDVDDPTTGEVFPADTEINLKDVVDEDPTPGYEAIAYTLTDHGALTGRGDDDHTQYALADGTRGTFAAPLGADDNYVTDAEKTKLANLSGTNTGDQTLPTWTTIAGKPAVVAAGATQADARTAIGAGTSSFSGVYADLTSKPTLGTAAATASTDYATAAQGAKADTAVQPADLTAYATDAELAGYATTTQVDGKVSKGELVVNVKDYGAKGDGVTDDRAAIVAAMTAAPAGGTILFPPGSYVVDAAVVITKALTWRGQGATIVKGATTTAAGNHITANVGGVYFRDLSFTDPSSKVTGNFFSSGAQISDIGFTGCTFNVPLAVVIRLARVTRGVVADCTISACKVGVQIENDAVQVDVRRVNISGWRDRGIYILGSTNAPTDVTVEGVRITGMATGGTPRYPVHVTKGAAPTNVARLAIIGCTIDGPAKSYTAADPGTADQISIFTTEDFRVIGNMSRNGGDMGITIDGSSKHGVVADNVCVGNDAGGIAIWTGVTAVSVSGNTCMNNGQSRNGDRLAQTKAGIRMTSATGVTIAGNTFGDDQGTKTQDYGVSMTTCTNVSLGPDVDAGNALATYYKDGAGNTNIIKVTTAAF